jgi:predicted PhzF superfamily epimerase YddE/YHI9
LIDVAVQVLRVFCGEGGAGGNALGVVMDGAGVPRDDRQAIAQRLGYAETVFVEEPASGRVRIHTPEVELPFAGHPCVGTGWLLRREGHPAEALLTPAGRVALRHDPDRPELCWARARAEWSPPFELAELDSPEAVDAEVPSDRGWRYVWAWIDRDAGTIRARSFVPEAGIPEDEATGSAAVLLCAALDRPIEIHQGRASLIEARPTGEDDWVEFGGRVAEDD